MTGVLPAFHELLLHIEILMEDIVIDDNADCVKTSLHKITLRAYEINNYINTVRTLIGSNHLKFYDLVIPIHPGVKMTPDEIIAYGPFKYVAENYPDFNPQQYRPDDMQFFIYEISDRFRIKDNMALVTPNTVADICIHLLEAALELLDIVRTYKRQFIEARSDATETVELIKHIFTDVLDLIKAHYTFVVDEYMIRFNTAVLALV